MSALLPVLDFATCYQLYWLFSTLPPVLDSAAWCGLCRLFSAFSLVLSFVACPQLCRLSSTFSPVLSFGACFVGFTTCSGLCHLVSATVSYSTIYPTPQTPSSLAWVQRMQAGLRPNSARRLAVRPPALAHRNPTGCSFACCWRLRSALRANQESFSIELGPLLDSKALCRQLRVVLQRYFNKYFM